jgi:hypothetical protein
VSWAPLLRQRISFMYSEQSHPSVDHLALADHFASRAPKYPLM